MGLLFKSKKVLQDRLNRIVKRQYGGTIPVYGSYQVKMAQDAPYNPMGLLAKYQGAQPTQKADSKGGDWKKDVELVGLSNDASFFMDEVTAMEQAISQGLQENPDFFSTRAGGLLKNQYDNYTTLGVQKLKNSEEEFDEATKNMYDNNSTNNWMFRGGKGLAARQVQNKDGSVEVMYEWIYPTRLNNEFNKDGSRVWEAVSYGDAANLRGSSADGNFLNNENFARDLSYGLGMNKALIQINGVFEDIGYTKSGQTSKIGGVTIDNQVIKEVASGHMTKTNQNQLNAAFATMYDSLKNTPAWDTLMSNAWSTSRTNEEAMAKVNQYLALQMAKRLEIETDDSSTEVLDFEKTFGSGAGASGTQVPLSKYLIEAAGTGEPEFVDLEMTQLSKEQLLATNDGTSTITSIPTWKANNANALKNSELTLSENDEFKQVGDVSQAMLPNGQFVKDIIIKQDNAGLWTGDSERNMLDMMVPSDKSTVRVSFVPMKDGKVFEAAVEDMARMEKELAEIDARQAKEPILAKPGSPMAADFDKERAAKKEEYLSKYYGKVTIQKFYLVDVVYQNTYLEDDSYLKTYGRNADPKDVNGTEATEHKDGKASYAEVVGNIDTGGIFNEGSTDNYSTTTVMIPINDNIVLQGLDGDVYEDRYDLKAGQIGSNPGNQPHQVTNSELNTALTQRIFGKDRNGGNIYQSSYLNNFLNQ